MNNSSTKKMLGPEAKVKLEAAEKELFSQKDFHQVTCAALRKKLASGSILFIPSSFQIFTI